MTTTYEMRNSTAGNLPDISTAPSTVYRAAIVMAGATQAASLPYAAPVTNEEERSVYYLPGGVNTVLTQAMMRYDIIAADNPAITTLEVPHNATLGLDFSNPAKDFRFYAQNRGAGGLAVNFTGGATLTYNYNNLAIETEGPFHPEQCFFTRAADVWGTT